MPCSRWMRRISSRISTRIAASSADSGSSSSSACGPKTSARASATRCCWPPDSSAGVRSAKASSPTEPSIVARASRRSARGTPRSLQRIGDVLPAPSCAGTARSSGRRCRCCARAAARLVASCPPIAMRPRVGLQEARDELQQRRLAAAARRRSRRPARRRRSKGRCRIRRLACPDRRSSRLRWRSTGAVHAPKLRAACAPRAVSAPRHRCHQREREQDRRSRRRRSRSRRRRPAAARPGRAASGSPRRGSRAGTRRSTAPPP